MNKWLRKLSSKLKMAVLVSGLLVAQVAGAAAPFMNSTVHANPAGNNDVLSAPVTETSNNNESNTCKDNFVACGPVAPVIATQVSNASVTLGQSVTDTATLNGTAGAVTGKVSFFVCGPAVSNPDCTSGGSAVGSSITIANGHATSATITPQTAGKYCFRAEYNPFNDFHFDESSYLSTKHTNLTTECFTVVLPTGTITVTKVVSISHGGIAKAADFPLLVNATPVTTGTSNSFPSGHSYTVSENGGPAGYTQTSAVCKDGDTTLQGTTFTLNTSHNITCTITNSDVAPKLTLKKVVTNKHGGNATSANFQGKVNGMNVTWGAANTETAGAAYTLSESALTGGAGYSSSSWSCDAGTLNGAVITLGVGQNATCTITNTDIAPKLTVIKKVINGFGGNAQPSDFTLNVAGTNNVSNSFPGADTPGTTVSLNVGTYSVSESAGPAGYTSSMSGNCTNVTVALADTKTCTVTNTQNPASISGQKLAVNAGAQPGSGGIAVKDWNVYLLLNGTTQVGQTTTDANGNYTFNNLAWGNYTVAECQNANDGCSTWTQIYKPSGVTVNGNNLVSINKTFGNFKNGSISGFKWNDFNGNGTKQENEPKISDWTIKLYKGETLVKTTPTDWFGNYSFTNLAPGTYTVCEGSKYGWVQTYPGNNSCYTVVIDQSGESNSNKNFGNQGRGTITVIKNVDDGFGHVTHNVTNWNWDVDGGSSHWTGNRNVIGTAAGKHTISEHQKDGYHVTASSCHNTDHEGDDREGNRSNFNFNFDNNEDQHASTSLQVAIDPGKNIVCTFTNTRDTGTITIVKNVDDGFGNVNKDVTNWTWNVDEEINHTTGSHNAVKFVTGEYTVSENQKAGYHVTASSCHNTAQDDEREGNDRGKVSFLFVQKPSTSMDVNLHYNDHIVCTFTNTRDTGTVTVNKVLFPNNDPGKFNLQVDGTTDATNVGNGGTTGAVQVVTGLHSVSEIAGTGTSLNDYDSTYSCTNGLQGKGTITASFTVNKGDSVSCTFTNQHKVVPQVLGASTSAGQLTNTGLPIVAFTLAAMTLLGTALFVGTSRRKSS